MMAIFNFLCTDASYKEFHDKLKEAEGKGEGRYAVYDCNYDGSNKKNKLLFIMW